MSKELKREYEDILLGKKKNYSTVFFGRDKDACHRNALEIIRYALEAFLRWTPQDIAGNLTGDIIELMKLETLIKYIEFPGELNSKTDMFYIAHLLYPQVIPFHPKEKTLQIYAAIVSKKIYRYPKGFWEGTDGVLRAKTCLKYMLQNYTVFHNVAEMYKCFSTSEGNKLLRQYQLMGACECFFDAPLDFLHETLSKTQRSEFYYHYYRFQLTAKVDNLIEKWS